MELGQQIAGIAGIIGTGLIVTELNAWAPKLSEKLIGVAAWLSSYRNRDRLREEWSADLNDQPGPVSKLIWASSALWGSVMAAAWRSLSNILIFGLLHVFCPPSTKVLFVHFTRWGTAAKKMRLIGHEIPWCAEEGGISDIIFGRYSFSDLEQLNAPFRIWAEQNNQIHLATYLFMFNDDFSPEGLERLRVTAPNHIKEMIDSKRTLTKFIAKRQTRHSQPRRV